MRASRACVGLAHTIDEFSPGADELLLGDYHFVRFAVDLVGVAIGHRVLGRMIVPRDLGDEEVPLVRVGLIVDDNSPLHTSTEETTASPHLYLHTSMIAGGA